MKANIEDAPMSTLAQNKKFRKWFGWLSTVMVIVIIGVVGFYFYNKEFCSTQPQSQTAQIYPNYIFQDGINRIKVPLIPTNQLLSCESGGWVTTPDGSEWSVDNKVPINMEFIDGRKIHCEPYQPIYVGVRPANRIFRIYGPERDSVSISIKRNVY